MAKKTWETSDANKTYYLEVSPTEVVVGEHRGTGQSDHGAGCSPREFLDGRFQGMVLSRFGEATLLEALAILGGGPADAAPTLEVAAPKPAPEPPAIPSDAISKIRQDLLDYDDNVSGHRQRVPAIDALAPDAEGMARCTPLTRAIQVMAAEKVWASVPDLDPNALDGNGASPLNMALLHPVSGVLAGRLLEAGAAPDSPDGNGVFPLEVAIATQQKQKFDALRKAKVDASRRFEGGRTYLHLAVERRCTLSFSELKKRKVPVDAMDDDGLTALHYAAHVGGAAALMKLKASTDVRDGRGESAIGLAARGALSLRRTGRHAEGKLKGKPVTVVLDDGALFVTKGRGKPRRLKFADEWLVSRFIEGHRDFLRFVQACVAMCKTADLDQETPSGVPIAQLIADIRRPDFDKVLEKRGIVLPRPRADGPSFVRPVPPSWLTRALNP